MTPLLPLLCTIFIAIYNEQISLVPFWKLLETWKSSWIDHFRLWMPLIYYLEVEYFRRPMRKVKVKHNLLCVYIYLQHHGRVWGKCIIQSFLAWYIKPQYVDIALILNMLSNIGTDWICIERLAFSNENWEKGESVENPH